MRGAFQGPAFAQRAGIRSLCERSDTVAAQCQRRSGTQKWGANTLPVPCAHNHVQPTASLWGPPQDEAAAAPAQDPRVVPQLSAGGRRLAHARPGGTLAFTFIAA